MVEARHICTLKNGLTVIVEELPDVESAAFVLYLPGGVIADEAAREGCCLMLPELTSRGAGPYDSRALSNAFDRLGIRHSESAAHDCFSYRGSMLAEYLPQALEYTSLMVRYPTLPEEEVDSIRRVFLQELSALEDNPAAKVMVLLNEKHFPPPHGRSGYGTVTGLQSTSLPDIRAAWERLYHPSGAVLSVAGNIKCEEVLAEVERRFGEWSGPPTPPIEAGAMPLPAAHHVHSDAAQLQIALAYEAPKFGEPHYYPAKVASNLLSGGSFGRLFVEVREKRGLCYSVHARHSATREFGTMSVYAGTTPQRADETLRVTVGELRRLRGSVTEDELSRAKVDLLSSVAIGEESTSARAGSNAADWWVGKRVRGLEEIRAAVNAVSTAALDAYLEAFPADRFTLATLGARQLSLEELDE